MYVCYFSMIDSLGNRIPGSVRVKLPVIPRIGDYVNVKKSNVDVDTVAGNVKAVDMFCVIDQEVVEFGVDTIPEPQELTWYITLEVKDGEKPSL